jgi:hypothetical protein
MNSPHRMAVYLYRRLQHPVLTFLGLAVNLDLAPCS